jgi:vanillate O-demethylase monooxygenase subunit
MFLKDCWYVAALDHELIDGKLLGRTLLGEHVLLFRGESGKVVALNDRCPHRGALLSKGRLEGDAVRCMYHGIKYDGSGKCVQIPGQDMIPPRLKVRGYPVVERSHFIWIWMGDAAKADPALIIDLPYLHDPNWKGIPAYLHYDANYLLIVDNLSDFSHLAFVHTGTLGGSEEYAFVTKPTVVEKLERGFRVERWHQQRPAAVPQKGDSRQEHPGGPPQYCDHDHSWHLPYGDSVRPRGPGCPGRQCRGRQRVPELPVHDA